MSIPQIFGNQAINNFLPAILKENKSGWVIEYYALHPVTEKLIRKQIRLQRIVSRYKSLKDARLHINRMVVALNAKLSGGWNPFFSREDARMYEKLHVVTELFLKEKHKELRFNSYRSYESFCKLLNEWLAVNSPDMLASMFSRLWAVRYMEYMYNERNVGANTLNNHLKMGRALFNWMKEKCYVKENPFDSIKPKTKTDKTRIIIPPNIRKKITADLAVNCPGLLIISKLVYNSLIRPVEIRRLQIKDINLQQRHIVIDKSISKNKKTRFATINQDIIDSLIDLHIERYPMDYYIFSEDMKPGKDQVHGNYYAKRWDKMRKRVGLPMEMQLYSLRDTGIHEMLKSGIDDLSVMQHADHGSLEMTTLYGNHFDPNLNNLIYTKAPRF